MSIDEACGATSPEGDKQQMGIFQQPVKGTNMIFKAIEFATLAHSGQYRKGTKIPYIVHPLAVGQILIEHGCSVQVVIAGILHDTLEDTRVTIGEINDLFGKEVADLVQAVSEPNRSDYTWENRKAHTINQLKTALPEQLLLTLADKFDNIKSISSDYEKLGDKLWKRFNRPKEKQKWFYETLADIFSERLSHDGPSILVHVFKTEVDRIFK
jgi:(p)ppGpp synthase/HD superfamily hydrolase